MSFHEILLPAEGANSVPMGAKECHLAQNLQKTGLSSRELRAIARDVGEVRSRICKQPDKSGVSPGERDRAFPSADDRQVADSTGSGSVALLPHVCRERHQGVFTEYGLRTHVPRLPNAGVRDVDLRMTDDGVIQICEESLVQLVGVRVESSRRAPAPFHQFLRA